MTIHEEYRASWPNDEWVWEAMTDRREFFAKFDDLCISLQGLSVPKAFWPVAHVRTITVQKIEGAWETWGEFQRKSNAPIPPSLPRVIGESSVWGVITQDHIDRVRDKRTALSEPCVICGHQFGSMHCSHSLHDTEQFIQYIRNTYSSDLRRKR
jgi:hypothetical protein